MEPMNDHFRRALLETIPCAVFMVDDQQRILYWNRSAEELTGYAAGEVIGSACSVLALDTCDQRTAEAVRSACLPPEGVESTEFECEIRRKDGSAVPIVRRIRPVRDEAGRLIGAIQALVDVSLIKRARQEIRVLEHQIARAGRYGELVGSSEPMQRLYEAIEMIAETDASAVIEGETGTGKELIARTIHTKSRRAGKVFLAVNCGALPEPLLEAELFGHVRGAFTGATADRLGRFEEAAGGTLLLDEVAELPAAAQVKLLRVLQEREITRLGENRPRKTDVRILAATNVDLAARVGEGRFREDLYYRLRVVGLHAPALRDRRDDIPELVAHFLAIYNERYGKLVEGVSPAVLQFLVDYDWPGNVRQLEHALEHAFIVTPRTQRELTASSLPPELARMAGTPSAAYRSARSAEPLGEKARVQEALHAAAGNKTQAAKLLGLTRAGLYKKLRRLDLAD